MFDNLVETYHYLGYTRPFGERLKYLVSAKGVLIACLAWSSAPRHIGWRDRFIGWPTSAKGKLAKFMKRVGVKHPSELVGKKATVRIRTKQGTDGTTHEFPGFITE